MGAITDFSENVILRTWDITDVDSFLQGITPDVVQNLSADFPHERKEIEKFILTSSLKSPITDFAIADKSNPKNMMGGISYLMHEDQSVELGYLWIASSFRRKGFGKSALMLLLKEVCRLYPEHSVFVQVYAFNTVEENVLIDLKFKEIDRKEVAYGNKTVELVKYQYVKPWVSQLNYDILSVRDNTFALRKWEVEDADKYCSFVQDDDIRKFLRPTFPLTKEAFIDYISHPDEKQFDMAITKNGEMAGGISVLQTEKDRCELLNFWVAPSQRGQKLGSICNKILSHVILEKTAMRKVFLYCVSTNIRLQDILKKTQYRHKSEYDKSALDRNGRLVNLYYYEMERPF